MRYLGFSVLFVVVGAVALVFLPFGGFVGNSGPRPDSVLTDTGESMTWVTTSRKMKEKFHKMSSAKGNRDMGNLYMEDYPRFDPVPSSKAAIKSGPIEHGTPLMPYVPHPTPLSRGPRQATPPSHPPGHN